MILLFITKLNVFLYLSYNDFFVSDAHGNVTVVDSCLQKCLK